MTFQNVDGYREFNPIRGYQRAVVKTTKRTGKTVTLRPDLRRYLIHVTVGRRLFDYPYPPGFTVAWGGGHSLAAGTYNLSKTFTEITGPTKVTLKDRDVLRLQHCAVERSSYALKGPGAPPLAACQTNRVGHTVQCEFTLNATNDPAYLFGWEYEIIASAIAEQIQGLRDALNDQTAVDPARIRDWHGSAAYGFNDPYEMSCAEYLEFDGIMGHVDAPGQNHWDPGNWNHELVSKLVTALLSPNAAHVEPTGVKPSDELIDWLFSTSRLAQGPPEYWKALPAESPEWASFTAVLQGGFIRWAFENIPPTTISQPREADYPVVRGDTLNKLARAWGVSLADLLSVNPSITNPGLIRIGQTIVRPVPPPAPLIGSGSPGEVDYWLSLDPRSPEWADFYRAVRVSP